MSERKRIPDNHVSFGAAMYWARNAAGLTLRALAEIVHLSVPFLSDLEHNRRTTKHVGAIADALGVDVDDLASRLGRFDDLTDWMKENPALVRLLRRLRAAEPNPFLLDEEQCRIRFRSMKPATRARRRR